VAPPAAPPRIHLDNDVGRKLLVEQVGWLEQILRIMRERPTPRAMLTGPPGTGKGVVGAKLLATITFNVPSLLITSDRLHPQWLAELAGNGIDAEVLTAATPPSAFVGGRVLVTTPEAFAAHTHGARLGLVVVDERTKIGALRADAIVRLPAWGLLIVSASPPTPAVITILGAGRESPVAVIQNRVLDPQSAGLLPAVHTRVVRADLEPDERAAYSACFLMAATRLAQGVAPSALPGDALERLAAGRQKAAALTREIAAARRNPAARVMVFWRYGTPPDCPCIRARTPQREIDAILAEARAGHAPLVACEIGAYIVGLNMQMFTHTIVVDPPLCRSTAEQVIGRVRRIGGGAVEIVLLVTRDTVEEMAIDPVYLSTMPSALSDAVRADIERAHADVAFRAAVAAALRRTPKLEKGRRGITFL
jgi:hypothetical protein